MWWGVGVLGVALLVSAATLATRRFVQPTVEEAPALQQDADAPLRREAANDRALARQNR